MMKRILLTTLLSVFCFQAVMADTLTVRSFRIYPAVALQTPYTLDSLNAKGKAFDAAGILKKVSSAGRQCESVSGSLPAGDGMTVHIASFDVETMDYSRAEFIVEGGKGTICTMDGREIDGEVKLEPGTHTVELKWLGGDKGTDCPQVRIVCDRIPDIRTDGGRLFSLTDNMTGLNMRNVSVSPSGKFVSIGSYVTTDKGRGDYRYEIVERNSGKVCYTGRNEIKWMPSTDEFHYTRNGRNSRELVACNPLTMETRVICGNIPEGDFTICPDGKTLIFYTSEKGPEEGSVHQILTPDDRQKGWRTRYNLALFKPEEGVLKPLTYGHTNCYLRDISKDGAKILFSTGETVYGPRPTGRSDVYIMDLESGDVKALVEDDGFIDGIGFCSEDGSRIFLTGSPEALGRIGCALPDGVIPSPYDHRLFLMDTRNGEVTAVRKDFKPSVEEVLYNSKENCLYLKVEDKDCLAVYRYSLRNGSMTKLDCGEDYVTSIDTPQNGKGIVYGGQSLCNAHRAYSLEGGKRTLLRDFSAERLAGIETGEGGAYEFISSRGDLINSFYCLPPHFDPERKYPMIVHYYGGCTPSERYMIGSYSPQMYAAQGYVFLVVNPSGAAGFGQEFASRHVNTAGEGVWQDIVEATERFCRDHPFVDSTRIGCFSASYGGFMTQMLLIKSDIFAAGISHAGISSHTGYWGEGYWGYSYSETCMAGNYPWTNKELYVDRSPLFMADKINTPLLFLHGSADTNVPISESIQMFTALKLLQKETAFVVVDGENHGISDFEKKQGWLKTIFAWFAKYLKDDSSWWDDMYPAKSL